VVRRCSGSAVSLNPDFDISTLLRYWLAIYIKICIYCDMNLSADFFRMLGDSQRLRILRLLSREKLNVSELTSILGAAQSGISRHLRLLREAGLVREDREGGWAYYRLDEEQFSNDVSKVWPVLSERLRASDAYREDDVRLQEILRQRKEEFREREGTVFPGRSWASWARTLGYVAPRSVVADLGCGEGTLTLEVARWAKRVIAVDRSRAMLDRGRELAEKRGVRNVVWKEADIEKVPLKDASVEIVLLSQVLHSVLHPGVVLREAHRILAPGGTLLVQELRSHKEEWVKDKLGDVWLGFEEKQLKTLLRKNKFTRIKLDTGSRRHGDPFIVLIGSGRKS